MLTIAHARAEPSVTDYNKESYVESDIHCQNIPSVSLAIKLTDTRT